MIEITVDFVNNIIKEYVGDDLGEYIVEEIKRIRQIDFECERYIEERRRLQREYNKNIAEQNNFITSSGKSSIEFCLSFLSCRLGWVSSCDVASAYL